MPNLLSIEHIADPDPAIRTIIDGVIDAHNDRHTGRPEPARRFAVVVRDTGGVVVGGVAVIAYYDWAFIDMLALPETARGQGIGTRLMRSAERKALGLGCHGIWLDTSSYQAPGFYAKLGYREFAQIRNHGPGWTKHWFAKSPLTDWPDQGLEMIDDPDEAVRGAIRTPLMAHSDAIAGPSNGTTFAVIARAAPDGPVLGGLWARIARGWTFVALLGLPEAARGQGVGTRLMRAAEAATLEAGGRAVWLDTFSFQARPFYERLGYTAFGELPDFPAPHRRYLLARRLDGQVLECSSLDGTRTRDAAVAAR